MSNAFITHISCIYIHTKVSWSQSEHKACQKHFSHTFHIIYIYIYIHAKVKGSQSEQNACQHHSCADLDKYTPTSWIKTREQSEQTACQDTHLPHKIAELLASLGQEKYEWNFQDPAKKRPNAPTPDFTIHVACGCSTRHEGETRDVEETHPKQGDAWTNARCKMQNTND